MNDPGLDEPIKQSSKTEYDHKDEKEVEKEDEQTFLNPRFEASRNVLRKSWHALTCGFYQSVVVRLNGLSTTRRAWSHLSKA